MTREKGTSKIHHPFRDYPQNMIITLGRIYGCNQKASYAAIEKAGQSRESISGMQYAALTQAKSAGTRGTRKADTSKTV